MNTNAIVGSVIGAIIAVIVVYQLVGATASDVGYAADNITAASGTYPLTGLFGRNGLILLLFMVGLLVSFIKMFGISK